MHIFLSVHKSDCYLCFQLVKGMYKRLVHMVIIVL